MAQRTKITVDLGDGDLYQAIKIAAVERRASLRQVVIEALHEWLRRQEDMEDLRDYREAKGDSTRPLQEFMTDIGG